MSIKTLVWMPSHSPNLSLDARPLPNLSVDAWPPPSLGDGRQLPEGGRRPNVLNTHAFLWES